MLTHIIRTQLVVLIALALTACASKPSFKPIERYTGAPRFDSQSVAAWRSPQAALPINLGAEIRRLANENSAMENEIAWTEQALARQDQQWQRLDTAERNALGLQAHLRQQQESLQHTISQAQTRLTAMNEQAKRDTLLFQQGKAFIAQGNQHLQTLDDETQRLSTTVRQLMENKSASADESH